jgi:uncharacterized protein
MRSLLSGVAFVLLCCVAEYATAQEQPVAQPPLMGSEAAPELPGVAAATNSAETLAPQAGDDGEFRILVIGDSLAGGLGAGLTRMAEADPSIVIVNRFNEVSGLARTELYDWPSALAEITAANPVDAVVVHVGVNDRQGIRSGASRLEFRSDEWQKAYTDNVDRLADAVKAANARLYWISIPPMADAEFDGDMKFLSDIHRARVTAKGGNYIDVRSNFLGPDGNYAERGPDEIGVVRKLRERDGIKLMKLGNNRFGQLVLGSIKTLEASAAQPQPEAPAAVPVVAAVQSQPQLPAAIPPQPVQNATAISVPPTMGQDGLDGEQIAFRADIKIVPPPVPPKPVELKPAEKVVDPSAGLAAKAGSQSSKLLKDGLPMTAPAGRFDDYTEPPVQP